MRNGKTALPVLVGIIVFGTAAFHSLFVEGEVAGTVVPGLHPTTEGAIDALLTEAPWPPAEETLREAEAPPAAPPVPRTVVKAPVRQVSEDGVPKGYVYWKTIRAKVTAYEPSRRSCGKYANGKTSIGQNAWRLDGVATDPTAIPYGTYLLVPGVGGRTVDDTGSAMRRSWRRYRRFHIDVRMSYYYQARRWGVKYLDVKLYRKAG